MVTDDNLTNTAMPQFCKGSVGNATSWWLLLKWQQCVSLMNRKLLRTTTTKKKKLCYAIVSGRNCANDLKDKKLNRCSGRSGVCTTKEEACLCEERWMKNLKTPGENRKYSSSIKQCPSTSESFVCHVRWRTVRNSHFSLFPPLPPKKRVWCPVPFIWER